MPKFEYTAIDLDGRNRRGTIDASDLDEARGRLLKRQWVMLALNAASPATRRAGPHAGGRRFRPRDLALATRQLSTLVAVSPLEEALRTIGEQSDVPAVRQVMQDTHGRVLEGQRLSEAMARQPRAFPPLYRAMVAAGEDAGALPVVLERLAALQERQQEVRGKLVSTLAYPVVLALTAVAVVFALMAFVVPRVVEQFDSMGRELPALTRAVIGTSELLADGWPLLLAGAAVLAFALRSLLANPDIRLRFDRAVLRLPVLGRLLRDLHAARMARTLAIMLGNGLPLIEGLALTVPTIRNRALRAATESMVASIREGGSLSSAMRRAGVFPPTLLYMAASGEGSGQPGPMLERAADYLERELNTFTAVVLGMLEPAIIVALGGVVAVIVLSILLPILQFNSLAVG